MALFDTAYSQALNPPVAGEADQDEDVSSSAFLMPSYMVAADTLNIANKNQTFGEAVVDTIQSIPKFVATSMVSGANQLYNVPRSIGNAFGGDYELSDTGDVITSLDSDLGAFYKEHKEGSDLVGFIASSLVPGMAGIKVLNAGQKSLETAIAAGKFGTNTGKALGLLVPSKQTWIAKAVKEAVNSSAAPMLTNQNMLRAMGAGLGQNVLEAAAFETFVAATMFDSPILEGQDFSDLASNILWGGLAFGAVGGLVDATRGVYTVKKAVTAADKATHPWKGISEYAATTSPAERIALDFDQLHSIPAVPAEGLQAVEGVVESLIDAKTITGYAASKAESLQLRIRTEIGKLAKGDEDAAQAMYDFTKNTSADMQKSTYVGVQEIARFAETTAIEKEIAKISKKIKLQKASVEEADRFANISVAHVRTWGDDAGRIGAESFTPTSIIDTLKKGQKIEVKGNTVTAGRFSETFSRDVTKDSYDILTANPMKTQARYIWAMKSNKLAVPTAKKPLTLKENDLPMLEKAAREIDEVNAGHVQIKYKDGTSASINSLANLERHIKDVKISLAHQLHENSAKGLITSDEFVSNVKLSRMLGLDSMEQIAATPKDLVGKYSTRAKQLTQEEIASIVNVRPRMLSGELRVGEAEIDDFFALQSYSKEYTNRLKAQGSMKRDAADIDIWNIPQHTKVAYDSTGFRTLNNNITENMVAIMQRQKVYTEGVQRMVASNLGAEDYAKLTDITARDIRESANTVGSGPTLVTAASSNYGSLGSKVEYVGNVTTKMIEKAHASTRELADPALYKLATKPEAAVEYSTINATLRAIPENYVLNEAGNALEPAVISDWKRAVAKITAENEAVAAARQAAGKKPIKPKKLPAKPEVKVADAPMEIPIRTPEAQELAKLHIEMNGKRTRGLAQLKTSQGVQETKRADVFYPTPVDPKDFPHFAIVTDESITGTGHAKMLYATNERELEAMISKVKGEPNLRVRTKGEAEAYYKSIGQWDKEKTLHDNYLDNAMHRKGVSAPYFVPTDPKKITEEFLNWHLQRDTGFVRENVLAKYEVPFEELRRLGDTYTNVATSKFSNTSLLKYADEVVKNPYGSYIKTALGLKNYADYPWWVATNRLADDAISRMYSRASNAWKAARTPEDLKAVNQVLKESGYKGAHYDEEMDLFANVTANKGVLSSVVQKTNSILASITLRLDTLNAANNAISANVLLGAESKAVIRAIERGDAEAVGKLADLAKITVPGTDKLMLSPSKLIANSIKKFGRDTPDMKFYKEHGFVTSISDQYRWTLDNMTFNGKESVQAWDSRVGAVHSKLRTAVEKGEEWTGNKLAEEFNRFVAADVMKQISDVAVEKGLLTAKEQLAYMNTFVNRTQGNYLASQRPMLFSGPIGQAVGLFQTYQFNLMQQLLRHVGEGQSKDWMTLLALQGTIHGMNGLPAFQAVNEHIIGTASGNLEHKDAYSATYGTVGKQAGDWLMYGLASNLLLHPDLKVNLYTRGDINPRHLTIIPTSPADVPIIGATSKVFGNIFETAKKISAGGDVATTILQGLEHNGVSRPLAGLAQTLEGLANPLGQSYSTSNRGNVIAANDLFSLANLARIAGGKPLDEAIAIDSTFRINAYGLRDDKKRQALGETIKTTMIAGQEPTPEQIEDFAVGYAKTGGKQEQFNTWMTQLYKAANLSQANKLQQNLNEPMSQSMQKIMGGYELRDFTE